MNSCRTCELSGKDCQCKHANKTPIRKRIIICCDGTWQSAVSGEKNVPSNVTRLCRALNSVGTDEDGEVWQQVVWYDSGVGTTSLALGTAIEGAIGQGLEGNVIEAYNFCVLNYNPGDKIMCFGFSRGAFTARTIAGLISDVGICYKKDLNKFPDLWAEYKKVKPGKRFHRSDLWFDWMWGKADEHQGAGGGKFLYEKVPQGDWAQEGSREIEVVGVYDTVGALGMPEVMGFKLQPREAWHNVGLSPNIKHAFQALALDEYRKAFSPSLWYIPNKTATREEVLARKEEEEAAEAKYWSILKYAKNLKENKASTATDKDVNTAAHDVNVAAKAWNKAARRRVKFQNRLELHPVLKQVWFPGYHIHVGGGSSATLKGDGDMEEMSNITFSWMLDQIKKHLSVDERYLAHEQRTREEDLAKLNDALDKWVKANKIPENESCSGWAWRHAKAAASAIAHPLTPSNEPAYKEHRELGWGTGQLKDSYSAMYWANGPKKRTPGEYALKDDGVPLGETFEYIHPVVNFRHEVFKELHASSNEKHPTYNPIGRDVNFKRRKTIDRHGHPWFVYDVGSSPKPLPEWKLGGSDSYERLAIAGDAAHAYVADLDEKLKEVSREMPIQCPKTTHFDCEFQTGDYQPVQGPLTTHFDCEFQSGDYQPVQGPLTTHFDCEYQSGDYQRETVESKSFSVTKVSKVEVSTREVAHEERFSAVY